MLKFTESMVTFSEFPDEISLCINISRCPCHCEVCHSSYLANDIGEPLYLETVYDLIDKNEGITCLGLMGGDAEPLYINIIANPYFIYTNLVFLSYLSHRTYSTYSLPF